MVNNSNVDCCNLNISEHSRSLSETKEISDDAEYCSEET